MGTELKPKQLTQMQIAFLSYLVNEAKGDLMVAKKMAGYSDSTMLSDVVDPLKDEILEASKKLLALNAVKATFGMLNILDAPQQLGAANKLKAATEVLDRVGITKKEEQNTGVPQGTIFILPPKNAKVQFSIDSEDKMIDVTPNEAEQE